MSFIAECQTCGVIERGDLEEVGDAAEDHEQFHDVRVSRVATDGGRVDWHYADVDSTRQQAGVGDQSDECPNGELDCPDDNGLPCVACFLESDAPDRDVATDGGQCLGGIDYSTTRKSPLPQLQYPFIPADWEISSPQISGMKRLLQLSHFTATVSPAPEVAITFVDTASLTITIPPNCVGEKASQPENHRSVDSGPDPEVVTDGGHSTKWTENFIRDYTSDQNVLINSSTTASSRVQNGAVRAPHRTPIGPKLPFATASAAIFGIRGHGQLVRPHLVQARCSGRLPEGDDPRRGGLLAIGPVPSLSRKSDIRSEAEKPYRNYSVREEKSSRPAYASPNGRNPRIEIDCAGELAFGEHVCVLSLYGNSTRNGEGHR